MRNNFLSNTEAAKNGGVNLQTDNGFYINYFFLLKKMAGLGFQNILFISDLICQFTKAFLQGGVELVFFFQQSI